MGLSQDIETLARWLSESRHAVAFTGAGISTDSGLPDFRGPDGVWTRRDKGLPPPRWTKPVIEPNPSHHALTALEKEGRLAFLISQGREAGAHQSRRDAVRRGRASPHRRIDRRRPARGGKPSRDVSVSGRRRRDRSARGSCP